MPERVYIGDRTYIYCGSSDFRIVQHDNEPFYFPQETRLFRGRHVWKHYTYTNDVPVVASSVREALDIARFYTTDSDILAYIRSELAKYQ